jgi:Xaa-Pro aminopeptidase
VPNEARRALLLHASSYDDPAILHASGFLAPDPFSYLETDGQRLILASALEAGRARKQSRATTVREMDEFGIQQFLRETKSWDEAYAKTLDRFLRDYGVRDVAVPRDFPLYLAELLRAGGVGVTIAAELDEERRRKTAEEVHAIEETQRAAEAGLDAAVRLVRAAAVAPDGTLVLDGAPLTSERVIAEIELTLLARGCVAADTIAAGGAQAADPHNVGHGAYRANEAIVIDIYPQSKRTRYFADMTRTVCRGTPGPEIVRMYETTLRAQQEGIAMLRPGITGREVHERIEDLYFDAGYGTTREGRRRTGVPSFIHGLGHGVGLAIHEAPVLGRSGTKPLEPGDVVTVEPGLYQEGVGGVRIEDLLVITETGARNLTRAPKELRLEA